MDVVRSCRCCLRHAADKDLMTPYAHLDATEIYSEMLEECFQIHLRFNSDDKVGICDVCVGRLRDASDFKLQVQSSQAELQARLQGALQVKDEEPPVKGVVEGDGTREDFGLREEHPVKVVETDRTREKLMLHEEFIIKSEFEDEDGTSEDEISYESAVKSEVAGDGDRASLAGAELARADTVCAREQLAMACAVRLERLRGDEAPRASQTCLARSSHGTRRASLAGAEPARPVSPRAREQLAMACAVRLERLRGDEAPRASQTCLARSSHGTRRASRMKDLPDDTAGVRAEQQAYTCDTCGEQFTDKSRLIKHIQAHSTPADKLRVTHSCKTCLKEFPCIHFYTKHDNTLMNNGTYTCDTCGAKFRTKSILISHVRKHNDGKRYPCEVCNKTFVNNFVLKQHQIIHHSTGKKPFTCDECNKQFKYKGNLIAHIRIHTGVKPYHCKLCNKQFTRKGNLDTHSRIHTGERPYSCTDCNKQFTLKQSLNRHKMIHTGVKPYSCKECNKKIRHKYDLDKHKKNVHWR